MFSASGGSPILGAVGRVCAAAGSVSKAAAAVRAAPAAIPRAACSRIMAGLSDLTSDLRNSLQAGDAAGFAGQFEDVHAGVGAIDHVDVAAVVGLQVVALDRDLAAVLAVDLDAALLGRLGDRGDEIADLLLRMTYVEVECTAAAS